MDKKELYVRFANESTYYTKIKLDLKKVKNIRIFKDEVFLQLTILQLLPVEMTGIN